jgi:hypothetical protein
MNCGLPDGEIIYHVPATRDLRFYEQTIIPNGKIIAYGRDWVSGNGLVLQDINPGASRIEQAAHRIRLRFCASFPKSTARRISHYKNPESNGGLSRGRERWSTGAFSMQPVQV